MVRSVLPVLFLMWAGSSVSGEPVVQDSLAHYIHPNADLYSHAPPSDSLAPPRDALSPREAVEYAVPLLLSKGISDLRVCEVRWIAAPVPGYLIDALGSREYDGTLFSVFRLGIHDGADEEYGEMYAAGNEFVYLARGTDSTGSTVWFPPPGPDATREERAADAGGVLSYEFLLDRGEFESLPERYTVDSHGD